MLYRQTVEIGLRSAELRSLTRASFDLSSDESSVTTYAKNRRQDTLPLNPKPPPPWRITCLARCHRQAPAEKDESRRFADFHALRHTFITGLVTGLNPKVAQTLARHSVITLTMDRYTHLYQGNLSAALDVLRTCRPINKCNPRPARTAVL
jgi:integrase